MKERCRDMKYVFALVFGMMLLPVVCVGDAGIENVIIRQRWPWSNVVDIDFVVTGEATGIKFTAKYDGADEFVLAEKDLSGKFKSAEVFEPGIHHVEWNPSSAGLGNVELKNFFVKVEPEDKTYLILNLNRRIISLCGIRAGRRLACRSRKLPDEHCVSPHSERDQGSGSDGCIV